MMARFMVKKRIFRGYTVEQLANVAGVDPLVIRSIEKGKGCKKSEANKLAQCLGLNEGQRMCLFLQFKVPNRESQDLFY